MKQEIEGVGMWLIMILMMDTVTVGRVTQKNLLTILS